MERPSKWQSAMNIARCVAQRSHDAETQVGAVLINNDTGAILATGCNGFVRGAPDQDLPNTRPEKYKYMVHAETNLVANSARHGISMDNCMVVCTHSPCVNCMRLLWQSGITKVVVGHIYRDFDDLLKMNDLAIEKSEQDGLIVLDYRIKI